MAKRKALGKGLSALIPDTDNLTEGEGTYFQCPIEAIEPNPYQPRMVFQDGDLAELADSIREKGILTPLLVSKYEKGYRLIAGERRWRAAQKAGLKRVPVVVRETTPVESLELALIENIHRQDLNPIEEAQAYQKWLETADTTQEALARTIGRDRSTIANMLRLLKLPKSIQKSVMEGKISMGHARVLAGLQSAQEQRKMHARIMQQGLSVRQAENLLKKNKVRRRSKKAAPDAYMQSLADSLKRSLGTRVDILRKGKQGKVVIHFYSDDELDRLLELLS